MFCYLVEIKLRAKSLAFEPIPPNVRSASAKSEILNLKSYSLPVDNRKAFPLRISKNLFDEIKVWSEQEMRSVNGQIEFLLREAVRRRKKDTTADSKDPAPE